MNGMCTRGVDCTWSHDVRAHSNRKTLPCKYFSAGTCAYGDNCRFSHGNEQYPPLNPFAPEFKAPAPPGSVSTPPTSPSSSVLSVTSTPPSMHEGQALISPFHHPAMAVQQHVIPTSSSSSSWANAPVFVPKGAAVATSTTKVGAKVRMYSCQRSTRAASAAPVHKKSRDLRKRVT